jgi:FAD/FMN-containing dehydrogenase
MGVGSAWSWLNRAPGSGTRSNEFILQAYYQVHVIGPVFVQPAFFFWAARGAGAGMFAIVTQFHLRLYPRPQSIRTSTYYYPLSKVQEVAEWFSGVADMVPPNVEMTLFYVTAPPGLLGHYRADNGKVCMLTAAAFADSKEEAVLNLSAFEQMPFSSACLAKIVAQPATFEDLFAVSSGMWPEGLRSKVESLWSNSEPGDMLGALRDHFIKAPNPKTVILFALYPGWRGGVAAQEDLALSHAARVYGGPWTMWEDAQDDAVNIEWRRRCCEILRPFVTGRYLGESDIVDDPSRAEEAFSPANWRRLKQLTAKYDPDGLFHGFSVACQKCLMRSSRGWQKERMPCAGYSSWTEHCPGPAR